MQSLNADLLLALRREPQELEDAFRQSPDAFPVALAEALDRAPDDLVFQAWAARLDLAPVSESKPEAPVWSFAAVLTPDRVRLLLGAVVVLIAAAGTWAKIPDLLGWKYVPGDYSGYERADRFHQRFMPFYVLLPLLGVLWARYRPSLRLVGVVGGVVAALAALQAVRPIDTDAGTLSALHLPLMLLSLGGVLALGSRWRNAQARLGYLQLMGESTALAGVLLLGGVVLVALTVGLFEAIGIEAGEVLFEWVALYGALGVLPVGAMLASQRVESARLAPLVARTFGPLALAVLVVYLPALITTGGLKNRDSLLVLNVMLVFVLALVLLMEAERPDRPRVWTDGVAAGLVVLALLADLLAFGSIMTRLADGLTPNRLAVVGLNALVLIHFAGMVGPLARRALGRGDGPDDTWTGRFLTVYALWSAAVVLVFPLF